MLPLSARTCRLAVAAAAVAGCALGSCHTALPPRASKDPALLLHAATPGEPASLFAMNVLPIAVDRRHSPGGGYARPIMSEPEAASVYYPRLDSRAIPRDVASACRALHLFPSVVGEVDPLFGETLPAFVRLHLAVDRYEIAFARRNGYFWFPGLPLSAALLLPGTLVGDETFVGYLEAEAAVTAGDDPGKVLFRKTYRLLREAELDECDRRILPPTTLSAPGSLLTENMEAAASRIFPFLVRGFTREIVADLASGDGRAALAAAGRP